MRSITWTVSMSLICLGIVLAGCGGKQPQTAATGQNKSSASQVQAAQAAVGRLIDADVQGDPRPPATRPGDTVDLGCIALPSNPNLLWPYGMAFKDFTAKLGVTYCGTVALPGSELTDYKGSILFRVNSLDGTFCFKFSEDQDYLKGHLPVTITARDQYGQKQTGHFTLTIE